MFDALGNISTNKMPYASQNKLPHKDADAMLDSYDVLILVIPGIIILKLTQMIIQWLLSKLSYVTMLILFVKKKTQTERYLSKCCY